jgi:sec-independent protein translocase protein TatA
MFGIFGPMGFVASLLIVAIIFGGSKIPQLRGALGKGMKDFRSALEGEDEMFGMLGPMDLVVILIVVIIFGGSKIPQLGGALGKGIKNFRTALKGEDEPPAEPEQPKEEKK